MCLGFSYLDTSTMMHSVRIVSITRYSFVPTYVPLSAVRLRLLLCPNSIL